MLYSLILFIMWSDVTIISGHLTEDSQSQWGDKQAVQLGEKVWCTALCLLYNLIHYTFSLIQFVRKNYACGTLSLVVCIDIKLDWLALLIAYPSPAYFTTIDSRSVCQNRNLCPCKSVNLLGPEKLLFLSKKKLKKKKCRT